MPEFKSLPIGDFSLKEDGDVLVAFAQTGVVDREGDYTFAGAFGQKEVPISAWSHASWPQRGGLPPTGRGSISERDGWGIFAGKFFMDTSHGRDAYATVKAMGDLQEWSYGYNVTTFDKPPVTARRGLKSVETFEVSPVLMGAGARTFTMGIKDATGNVFDGMSVLSTIMRLIDNESDGLDDADAADDAADVTLLAQIRELIKQYVAMTIGEVGSDDDMADRAAAAAATPAYGYASHSFDPETRLMVPAAMKFDDHLTRVSGEGAAFADRLARLVDLRLKDGRKLSTKRRETLQAYLEQSRKHLAVVEALLSETEPAPKAEASKAFAPVGSRFAELDRGLNRYGITAGDAS